MSDNYITASIDILFEQSKDLSEMYFNHASIFLDGGDFKDEKFEDYMRIAELSANNFRTSLLALNIQRIAEKLDKISDKLDYFEGIVNE